MLKQVFIINKDLDMGKGKIAVQVGHGEVIYMNYMNKVYSSGHTEFDEWMKDGVMKKVVLKAPFSELIDLCWKLDKQTIWYSIVRDMGLTQVPKDSITCIVTEPLEEELTDKLFGHLKLL
jgi:PTH2 family peptidyl-tRNA hydrolase